MNRFTRFVGRKSMRRLTEESTSMNRNDEGNVEEYTEDQPPIFDFPGRIDPMLHPTLATNPETHLSHRVGLNVGKGEMKLRCAWASVNKWWDAMQGKGDCFALVIEEILQSPFGSLFRCGYAVADRALIYTLIERWWDTTHTFHFPQGEIGITPLDVTMLTGMSIGSGRPVTFGGAGYTSFVDAGGFWPSLRTGHWAKGGIKPTFFVNEFIEATAQSEDGWCPTGREREIYVRSFYFYLITQCFFPTGDSSLRLGWVQCLEDLQSIHEYDWGGAMFAALITAMDLSCRPRSTVAEGQCGGFTPLLQYWWYEYVPAMAPLLNQDIPRDIVPRMSVWQPEFRLRQSNQGRHNIHLDRNQLEFRSGLAINWTPWYISRYVTFNADDMEDGWEQEATRQAQRSHVFSQCRMVFEYADMVVWYLGDRCWRQLSGTPLIPHPPPLNMRPVGGASPWRVFLREHAELWPHALQFLDEQGDYESYWGRVSRGPILPSNVYRAANMDFVGHSAIRSDVRIPYPAEPYSSSQGPYVAFDQPAFDPQQPWSYDIVTSRGMQVNVPIPEIDRSSIPTLGSDFDSLDKATLRDRYVESQQQLYGMKTSVMNTTDEYYHYLLAEKKKADDAERKMAEMDEELKRMSLEDARRMTKSRKRQPGEESSRR